MCHCLTLYSIVSPSVPSSQQVVDFQQQHILGHYQMQHRHGKAPPVDEFTAEDSRTRFDDWIPTLERAASWNGWTEDELLAGHLRGRALLE